MSARITYILAAIVGLVALCITSQATAQSAGNSCAGYATGQTFTLNTNPTQTLVCTNGTSGTWAIAEQVNNNAHVGINQSSPQAQLDVNGGVRVGGDSSCSSSNAGEIIYLATPYSETVNSTNVTCAGSTSTSPAGLCYCSGSGGWVLLSAATSTNTGCGQTSALIGSQAQILTVQAGCSVTFYAWGGGGGGGSGSASPYATGGGGGATIIALGTTSSPVTYLLVVGGGGGGGGNDGVKYIYAMGGASASGYTGGGGSNNNSGYNNSGGGGGATGVWIGSTGGTPITVAGGGAGGGQTTTAFGGGNNTNPNGTSTAGAGGAASAAAGGGGGGYTYGGAAGYGGYNYVASGTLTIGTGNIAVLSSGNYAAGVVPLAGNSGARTTYLGTGIGTTAGNGGAAGASGNVAGSNGFDGAIYWQTN